MQAKLKNYVGEKAFWKKLNIQHQKAQNLAVKLRRKDRFYLTTKKGSLLYYK